MHGMIYGRSKANNSFANPLKGVVTPFTQKYRRTDSVGFQLSEILDGEMWKRFKKNTFPKVEKTSDGKMFIQPRKHVMSTMENHHVKWLVLTTDYKPVHDHNYPMVQLPKNGYIMKVVIPITSEKLSEFMIEYVIDYNNIQIESINTIGNIKDKTQEIFQMTRDENISIKFNIDNHRPVLELISNREEFFSKYLSDAVE